MRAMEKFMIAAGVILFITMLGGGYFSEYVRNFGEGLSLLALLSTHAAETGGMVISLVLVIVTLINSARGRKKRGK